VIISLLQSAWRDQKFLKQAARSSPLARSPAEQFCDQEYRSYRPFGQWSEDGLGRARRWCGDWPHLQANAAPVGTPWMWTFGFGYHEDRTLAHGYEATREAAVAAFAKGWRRE
jgi:hypothetical protein